MIEMGDRLSDKVTGLVGIAIGRSEYLNGCVHWCLKPPIDEKGKMVEGEWIDEEQLEIVEKHVVTIDRPAGIPGGPAEHPKL